MNANYKLNQNQKENRVINGIFKKTDLSRYHPIKRRRVRRLWRRMGTEEREAQW